MDPGEQFHGVGTGGLGEFVEKEPDRAESPNKTCIMALMWTTRWAARSA